jgi:hypothetical protein
LARVCALDAGMPSRANMASQPNASSAAKISPARESFAPVAAS